MRTADIKVGGEYAGKYGSRLRVEETGILQSGNYSFSRQTHSGVRVTFLDKETGEVAVHPEGTEKYPNPLAGQVRTATLPSRDIKQPWDEFVAKQTEARERSARLRSERDANRAEALAALKAAVALTHLDPATLPWTAERFLRDDAPAYERGESTIGAKQLAALLTQAYHAGRQFEISAERERNAQEEDNR